MSEGQKVSRRQNLLSNLPVYFSTDENKISCGGEAAQVEVTGTTRVIFVTRLHKSCIALLYINSDMAFVQATLEL